MRFLPAVAAALLSAISMIAAPAPASAAGSISITDPIGAQYFSGTDITVSGYNSTDWSVSFVVECSSGRWDSHSVEPGSFSVSIGRYAGPDSCEILDDYYERAGSFTVAAQPAYVSGASVSAAQFYPRVRDRYRDDVVLRWTQSNPSPATIQVFDAQRRIVRVARIGVAPRRATWRWDGRNRAGNPVPAGRYRLHVTAGRNGLSVPVTVATGFVTRSFSARKEGDVGSFSTGGSCFARRDTYFEVATLDCWGGRFAKASYRIALPAGAFDVRGSIDLNPTSLDYCCRGRITRGWSRPSARVVTFWARVSGWRATEVNYVRATYKLRVRI